MAESPAIVLAFLERIAADRAAGVSRSLAEYQAQFPGHESTIANALEALTGRAEPAADSASTLGGESRFGDYRLLAEIGRGGQGAVYLAEDTRLGRRVALKVLLGSESAPLVARERFRREAIVASRLQHPGICTVFEAGELDGVLFVAMAFVPGEPLAKRIARDGAAAQPPSRELLMARCRILEEIALALHAAHEAGIVHRDVKPGNVMITEAGHAVVLDFGLARDLDETAATLTRSGEIYGTPAYLSPEQLAPDRVAIDRRTDVFSLGVTAFEWLAGRRPFAGATHEGLFRAILEDDPPTLTAIVPGAPRELAIVLETALAKDRNHRYSTALALAEDLKAVRESRPISARRPSALTRMRHFVAREPMKAALAASLALALLVAAGALGYLAANSRQLEAGEVALRNARIERSIVAAFAGSHGLPDVRSLEELIAENPDVDLLRMTLAFARLERGEFENVLTSCGGGTTVDARAALDRIRAAALTALGRTDEAAAIVGALEASPRSTAALESFVLGALLELRHKDTDDPEAERLILGHYSRAVALSPRAELAFHYRWALAAMNAVDQEAAALASAALEALWPESAVAWFAIGSARGRCIGPTEAIPALRRAVALEPHFVEAWLSLGVSYLILGQNSEADAAYDEARACPPTGREPWRLHSLWGNSLYRANRYDAAIPVFEAAVALAPELVMEWKLLASCLRQVKRPGDAIPIARRLLERDPNDGDASKLLRRAYAECGDLAAAIAECERRLAIANDDTSAAEELEKYRTESR